MCAFKLKTLGMERAQQCDYGGPQVPTFVQRPSTHTDTTTTQRYFSRGDTTLLFEKQPSVVWLWCRCGVPGLWVKAGTNGPLYAMPCSGLAQDRCCACTTHRPLYSRWQQAACSTAAGKVTVGPASLRSCVPDSRGSMAQRREMSTLRSWHPLPFVKVKFSKINGVHVSGAPSMERELIERRVGRAPSVER